MRLDRFVSERQAGWDELEVLTRRSGGRAEKLGPQGALRLGALYRSSMADLALARTHFRMDPATERLESLVLSARQVVYADEQGTMTLRYFVTTGYWKRITEKRWALFLALALLFVPLALAAIWAVNDPGAAVGIVPQEFRGAAQPGNRNAGLSADERSAFASQIFTNNIGVSFLAFAGGLLVCLGTAGSLIFNGSFIGAIMGLAIDNHASNDLFRLIIPHGVLELSVICISGVAGLRMGWAIIAPGLMTRSESLRKEARAAVEIIVGTIPWFILAGLIEGFVTPSKLPLPAAILLGGGVGTIYWGLVIWRGFFTGGRVPLPADRPERTLSPSPTAVPR